MAKEQKEQKPKKGAAAEAPEQGSKPSRPKLNNAASARLRDKYKKEGHEVTYVEIAGLGHEWATKQSINDRIWEFFEKHPRK